MQQTFRPEDEECSVHVLVNAVLREGLMVCLALLDAQMVQVCVEEKWLGRVCEQHGQIAIDHCRRLFDVQRLKDLCQTDVGACRVKAQNIGRRNWLPIFVIAPKLSEQSAGSQVIDVTTGFLQVLGTDLLIWMEGCVTVTCDADIDDVGVDGVDILRAQTQTFHNAGAEALKEDVDAGDEVFEHEFPDMFVFYVEGKLFLFFARFLVHVDNLGPLGFEQSSDAFCRREFEGLGVEGEASEICD